MCLIKFFVYFVLISKLFDIELLMAIFAFFKNAEYKNIFKLDMFDYYFIPK